MNLHTWALKWGISVECLRDLQITLGTFTPILPPEDPASGKGEAWAQSAVRLEASQKGYRLFRNNVGALKDATGRVVRYGLANDSAAVNAVLKSSDLIGWKSIEVTPNMVGFRVAQFVAREIKEPGWQYTGDDHERAQLAFLNMASSDGGDARFATGVGTL